MCQRGRQMGGAYSKGGSWPALAVAGVRLSYTRMPTSWVGAGVAQVPLRTGLIVLGVKR